MLNHVNVKVILDLFIISFRLLPICFRFALDCFVCIKEKVTSTNLSVQICLSLCRAYRSNIRQTYIDTQHDFYRFLVLRLTFFKGTSSSQYFKVLILLNFMKILTQPFSKFEHKITTFVCSCSSLQCTSFTYIVFFLIVENIIKHIKLSLPFSMSFNKYIKVDFFNRVPTFSKCLPLLRTLGGTTRS